MAANSSLSPIGPGRRYARERGCIENARKPFAAASAASASPVESSGAWQILAKNGTETTKRFWGAVGGGYLRNVLRAESTPATIGPDHAGPPLPIWRTRPII
jgi:hypothetical protein